MCEERKKKKRNWEIKKITENRKEKNPKPKKKSF